MTEPSREEWLAARERIAKEVPDFMAESLKRVTEAALGPCPPDPMPRCDMEVQTRHGVPVRLSVAATNCGVVIELSGNQYETRVYASPEHVDQLASWFARRSGWELRKARLR